MKKNKNCFENKIKIVFLKRGKFKTNNKNEKF